MTLLHDQIEETELDAAMSRDHFGAAETFEKRAAESAPGRRAELLLAAGAQYQIGGDPGRAVQLFRSAVSDGGTCWIDARAHLADALLGAGETREAADVLAELRRRRNGDPELVLFVGESLEAHGNLRDAHSWFTFGVVRCTDEGPGSALALMALARFRVRRALGLPLDDIDEQVEARGRLTSVTASDDLPPGAELALLAWPKDDYERLARRWPEEAAQYGGDHEGHRRQVELTFRRLRAEGTSCHVTLGRLDELDGFCSMRGLDGRSGDVRTRYSETLDGPGRTVAWPPARNAACWCGSGARYKRCCARLG